MMFVHSVVARTYLPNPKCEKEINHIDGNKHNNNVGNLEWSNRSDNMKHAYKLGLLHNLGSGENHSQAKLTWQKVAQIKGRYIRGVTKQRDLANEYGVSQRVIWGIVNGKLWVNASCK